MPHFSQRTVIQPSRPSNKIGSFFFNIWFILLRSTSPHPACVGCDHRGRFRSPRLAKPETSGPLLMLQLHDVTEKLAARKPNQNSGSGPVLSKTDPLPGFSPCRKCWAIYTRIREPLSLRRKWDGSYKWSRLPAGSGNPLRPESVENASFTRHPRRSRIVGSRRCDVPTALPIMLNATSTQEVGQLHHRATSNRRVASQIWKARENRWLSYCIRAVGVAWLLGIQCSLRGDGPCA